MPCPPLSTLRRDTRCQVALPSDKTLDSQGRYVDRQRRYPLGERTEDAASAAGRPGAGRKEADIGVKSAMIEVKSWI